MLMEAKRLYRLGFGIHWIKEKSKAPLKPGWGKGVRLAWDILAADYRPGLNLGCELGRASKFADGTCLAVIDCDVKSDKPEHREQMEKRLRELFNEPTPMVWTGRGNGSRHIYIRTAEPLVPKRYAQSPDRVKLKMPSAEKPSAYEKQNLSEKEIRNGVRIRPAWEISLMGEGQQVVLPPSLHPDTGRAYKWNRPVESWEKIANFAPVGISETSSCSGNDDLAERVYRPVHVDALALRCPDHIADMVISGKGVTDRSATLLLVAISMLKKGYSDDEILSLLTDRETFLGDCAYDHAKTDSRAVAMRWVAKYTLVKAKQETDAKADFDDFAVIEDLSDEEVKKQTADIEAMASWRDELERTSPESGARLKNTLRNVCLILKGDHGSEVFKYNEFSGQDLYGTDTVWGGKKGEELKEIDLSKLRLWFSEKYNCEPPIPLVHEAIRAVSNENKFHPVRDYLDGLEWDGKPRLNHWLKKYLGARGPWRYVEAIACKTIVAMVKRIYEPGCKYDQVLILEGLQGIGKSTAVRILSQPWFSDGFLNIGDKDAVLSMRSVWVVELGELGGMRKADVNQLKEFISRQADRIRTPYGRVTENFPRQCIFIGTTNSDDYLSDPTGNRRFWPVEVGACDFKGLERARDQLIAEAKVAYQVFQEPLYLVDERQKAAAADETDKRTHEDTWVERIQRIIFEDADSIEGTSLNTDRILVSDILDRLKVGRDTKAEQMRVAHCLKKLGFEQYRACAGGAVTRAWRLIRG